MWWSHRRMKRLNGINTQWDVRLCHGRTQNLKTRIKNKLWKLGLQPLSWICGIFFFCVHTVAHRLPWEYFSITVKDVPLHHDHPLHHFSFSSSGCWILTISFVHSNYILYETTFWVLAIILLGHWPFWDWTWLGHKLKIWCIFGFFQPPVLNLALL